MIEICHPHVFGKSAQANENKRVSLRYENHQNALGKIERTEIPTKAFYHVCTRVSIEI